MSQFLGFGDGSDGAATLSGTDAPIDSSCSGTAGATSLTATNASFAANQLILIHQSRGTGAGAWEINKILSYVAGTITTVLPLDNTYTDSGASQAQVLVLPQYSSVTVSGTLTAKAWDGNVGGIVAFLCNGKLTVSGTITTQGKGFRGGARNTADTGTATQGESSLGVGSVSNSRNGMGGGGATKVSGSDGAGGGGAGHGTPGGNGQNANSSVGGQAGTTGGIADLTILLFGAGGGGATGTGAGAGNGVAGGGITLIFAKFYVITGIITSSGLSGESAGETTTGSGGSSAGGSNLLKGQTLTLGSNLVTAIGGSAATAGADGGNGGNGRIRNEACSRTGTTNPSASEDIGGHDFCAGNSAIL